jgi:hypothetical protein
LRAADRGLLQNGDRLRALVRGAQRTGIIDGRLRIARIGLEAAPPCLGRLTPLLLRRRVRAGLQGCVGGVDIRLGFGEAPGRREGKQSDKDVASPGAGQAAKESERQRDHAAFQGVLLDIIR